MCCCCDISGCALQLHSIAGGGLDNLVLPSEEEKRKAYEAARQLPMSADGKKWRLGEQDFEALMKHLDNVVCSLGCLLSQVQAYNGIYMVQLYACEP